MLGRISDYWKRLAGDAPEDGKREQPPSPPSDADAVVFSSRVRLEAPPSSRPHPAQRSLADTTLRQIGLLDDHAMKILRKQQIRTAAEFTHMAPDALLPRVSVGQVKRMQQAVRMAHAIDGMRPWHAIWLFAIHRRSPNKLAGESPAVLHRDLIRFSWSSRGQKVVGQRQLPSLDRVRSWIESARIRQQRQQAKRALENLDLPAAA